MSGLFLALDPGKRKTGVALGNTITETATVLETVRGKPSEQMAQLAKLARVWQPQWAVVGLPAEASAKQAHAYSKQLAAELRDSLGLKVEFIDEAYSTQAARSDAKQAGGDVDSHAARLLAEDWMAAKKHSG